MTNLDRYKKDLAKLLELGTKMRYDLLLRHKEEEGELDEFDQKAKQKLAGMFFNEYQKWYSEACSVIEQLLPRRLREFEEHYVADPKRKTVDVTNYKIQDWLQGMRVNSINALSVALSRFNMQEGILMSAESRFESSLFDIKQLVQADLFDSELASSRELLKHGFLRGAGAVAGVVLEKHLEQVCSNHSLAVPKNPTIAKLNDLLLKNNVLETAEWRFVQRLGDLRNLCDHNRKKKPTKTEVGELIDGVDKISKTIF